tara:strand:- start:381 stop:809 length:429 start_codon:yes stop_codon:yes gene_type:complete
MADKKVSQLTGLTTTAAPDLMLVIDDPNGTPVSKSVTVKNFFGAVPANTSLNTGSTLTVTGNTTFSGSNTVVSANVNLTSARSPRVTSGKITLAAKTTVSSNNTTTLLGGGHQGSIFWDENFLYVATSNTVIKRVALSTFAS